MNIPIVYEDRWLVVVNKPAGLLTVPTPRKEMRTLTSILNLPPCHRLDRETSGLIIYARTKEVQKRMMQFFKERRVKKVYLAFVNGNVEYNRGSITKPVEGLSSRTDYEVTQRKGAFTVVRAFPLTGRTNQIRIHFKSIGHPVLGDYRYAFRRDFLVKAKRVCLHAQELDFPHPVTDKGVHLSCDLPLDMLRLLEDKAG